MDGWTDVDIWIYRQIDRCMDGLMDGQMDGWIGGRWINIERCMNRQVDNGQMDGWMDG